MPRGMMRRLQRMIAGLLVLAVLLSGAHALTAVPHRHDTDGAGLIIAVTDHGITTPSQPCDHHHGLPCCIGGHCMSSVQWLPAQHAALPRLSQIAVAPATSRAPRLVGIVAEPSSPPPRTIG